MAWSRVNLTLPSPVIVWLQISATVISLAMFIASKADSIWQAGWIDKVKSLGASQRKCNSCSSHLWCRTDPLHFGRQLPEASKFQHESNYIYIYIYIYRFQNVFLRCPTPRLHCFLSFHWPSLRFLSFMAFLIPSIQFSSVFLVLSFVSASTLMLFWVIFLLPLSEHGRTM